MIKITIEISRYMTDITDTFFWLFNTSYWTKFTSSKNTVKMQRTVSQVFNTVSHCTKECNINR